MGTKIGSTSVSSKTMSTNYFNFKLDKIGNYTTNTNTLDIDYGDFKIETTDHKIDRVFDTIKTGAQEVVKFKSKVASTVLMAGAGVVEGALNLVEHLGDGVFMVAGGVASIGTGIYDGIASIFDKDHESVTKAMWTKGIMPGVAYNWSSDVVMDGIMQTDVGRAINKNSFGFMQRKDEEIGIAGGNGYEITKAATEAAGIVVASVFTCGAAGIASGTSAAAGVMAGYTAAKTFGESAEKSFKKMKNEDGNFDDVSGKDIAVAASKAYAKGIIDGAFVFAGQKIATSPGKTGTTIYEKINTKLNISEGWKSTATTNAIKASKSFVSEGAGYVIDKIAGNDATYNIKDASIKAAGSFIGESAINILPTIPTKDGFITIDQGLKNAFTPKDLASKAASSNPVPADITEELGGFGKAIKNINSSLQNTFTSKTLNNITKKAVVTASKNEATNGLKNIFN